MRLRLPVAFIGRGPRFMLSILVFLKDNPSAECATSIRYRLISAIQIFICAAVAHFPHPRFSMDVTPKIDRSDNSPNFSSKNNGRKWLWCALGDEAERALNSSKSRVFWTAIELLDTTG
jgi:hypothetical protein